MPSKGMAFLYLKFMVLTMIRINCPMCGSDETEIIPQPIPNTATSQQKSFSKPPMQNLMQHVVNYAVMGASSARMIKGQRPIVYVIGSLIGGVIGCAVCFLNHVHEHAPDPMLKQSPKPQTLYQCLECNHHFALAFEQGEYNSSQHPYFYHSNR